MHHYTWLSTFLLFLFTSWKPSWVESCLEVATPFIPLNSQHFFNLFISLNIGFSSIPLPGVPFHLIQYILYFYFLRILLFIIKCYIMFVRVNISNQRAESVLGCFEISFANSLNPEFFTLASDRLFWTKTKSSPILSQSITRIVSRPHIKIFLP